MARPVKFDRDDILERGMNLVWKDGYEASSVKALSEKLGITRSSFYNAFGTREDFFRELMSVYARQSPDLGFHQEGITDVLPLVTSVFRDICRARGGDKEVRGCMLINSLLELVPEDDELGEEISQMVRTSARRLETLMVMARDNGEIPAESDPHALGLALQNLMMGLNVLCKVVHEEEELWALARTTLQGLGLYKEV